MVETLSGGGNDVILVILFDSLFGRRGGENAIRLLGAIVVVAPVTKGGNDDGCSRR